MCLLRESKVLLCLEILDKDIKDLLPRKEGWGREELASAGLGRVGNIALYLPSLFLQGQRRAQRHGECCEECVSPAGSCSHNGIVRYQDEMWKGSACEFCMCDHGQVTCQTGECAKVECARVRSKGISTWTVTILYKGIAGPSPVPYFLAAKATARLTTHISQSLLAQRFCGVK